MLYHIDESVVEAAKNNDLDVVNFLIELKNAWLSGQCLVSASKKSFLELIQIPRLNEFSLVSKYAQGVHCLYDSLDFFVVLVSNHAQVCSMQQFANKYVVMDVSEYSDIKQIHNNYLVCENVKDCEFYVSFVKHLLVDKMRNVYQLNILNSNGGGGTIVDVLKSNQEYACLVICDSDKKYPKCGNGQTLEGVSDYYKSQYNRRLWMYALHVHEIENLVPLKLLEFVVRGDKRHKKSLDYLKSIKDLELKNVFLKYFDFKKGLGAKLLRKIKEEDPQFYEKCCQVLLQTNKKQHDIDKAVENSNVAKSKDAAQPLINGISDGFLREVLDYLQNNDVNPQLLDMEDFQKEDWHTIANMVWSLGCAMKQLRL